MHGEEAIIALVVLALFVGLVLVPAIGIILMAVMLARQRDLADRLRAVENTLIRTHKLLKEAAEQIAGLRAVQPPAEAPVAPAPTGTAGTAARR